MTADENLKMREIATASQTRIFLYGLPEKAPSLLVRGTFLNIEQARKLLKSLAEEEVPEEARTYKALTPTVTPSSSFSSLKVKSSLAASHYCFVY